jgi:RNA polymerase sigma factor (sigma-70 family)
VHHTGATGFASDTPILVLAGLERLPLAVRADRLREEKGRELADTIQRLRACVPALPETVDVERLAWAVAFNVEGPALADATGARGIRCYADRWPPETDWSVVWAALRAPLPHASGTPLGELAWSVACEHRRDWQNPDSAAIDPTSANRAFELVYARDRAIVVGDVARAFGQSAGAPPEIADEAWARVFCDYWSVRARRRFLGLSRISTLVCQVARYVATDILRQRHHDDLPERAGNVTRSGGYVPSPEEIGVDAGVEDVFAGDELQSRIRECVTRLPPRQRLVAEMVWLWQIRAKRVAESLHISEPAVSQHLKKARELLARCLGRAG